jgi:hypothetical protein
MSFKQISYSRFLLNDKTQDLIPQKKAHDLENLQVSKI